MRLVTVVLGILFLCFSFAYAQEAPVVTAPVLPGPEATTVTTEAEATLPPAFYPKFTDFQGGTDDACEAYLKTPYDGDGTEADKIAQNGLSGAPIDMISNMGDGKASGVAKDFETIPGLVIENFAIPEENRKTAKIKFTWTVRVENDTTAVQTVRGHLCKAWRGSTTQTFDEGPAQTALFIDDAQKGEQACITMPGKVMTAVQMPPPPRSDPTITGVFLLSPAHFEGSSLPATIAKIEVRWKNETSMNLFSPVGEANLVIEFIPIDG